LDRHLQLGRECERHRAAPYFCRNSASASARRSISDGSTLAFSADQALRLLDSPQEDLRVRRKRAGSHAEIISPLAPLQITRIE